MKDPILFGQFFLFLSKAAPVFGSALSYIFSPVVLPIYVEVSPKYLFYKNLNSNHLKSCSTNVLLLYPLKLSENQRFSDVFRGYRSEALVGNGLSTTDKFKEQESFF